MEGGDVRKKVIFHDEGGRGVKPKRYFRGQGGEGGSDPRKKYDIIF